MLTVATFKWKPLPGYRAKFRPWHVNRMEWMFRKHLHMPFEFVCITDDPAGLSSSIRVIPLWDDLANVPNPHGPREPSCYRRLKLFSHEARGLVGERVLWIDLDMVLTGDVTPLFDRTEDVVLLSTDVPHIPVNGSLVLLTPGAHAEVWESFDPKTSPKLARKSGCYGSDQGWLAYCLKDTAAMWKAGPGGDGIYFFGQHMRRMGQRLPADARLVSMHGRGVPWGDYEQSLGWVRQHYGTRPEERIAA
jgi:hypothetical protein